MRLSVTTPRGSLLDADVDEVTAPGVLGEFGVLPGHIPFLSAIRPGVLALHTKQGTRLLAVGEGILQVARGTEQDQVRVLVDQAAFGKDLDRDAAAKELAAIDADLAKWSKDLGGEYKATLIRRSWAQARVDAAARAHAS